MKIAIDLITFFFHIFNASHFLCYETSVRRLLYGFIARVKNAICMILTSLKIILKNSKNYSFLKKSFEINKYRNASNSRVNISLV